MEYTCLNWYTTDENLTVGRHILLFRDQNQINQYNIYCHMRLLNKIYF